MTLVDQNGHSLSGSDDERLPGMGKEAKEVEEAEKPMETIRDARLLRLGSAITQLSVVCNNLMSLGMALKQAAMMASMNKEIIDSKELVELKEQMKELTAVQQILEHTINQRAQAIDEAYWAELDITPEDVKEPKEEAKETTA